MITRRVAEAGAALEGFLNNLFNKSPTLFLLFCGAVGWLVFGMVTLAINNP